MSVDLYAIFCVRDYSTSERWYTQFFGVPPSFRATETECVWELSEKRSFVIEEKAEHAGHYIVTVFVEDFDDRISAIAARGIEPESRVQYGNGVRKAIFHDPDGNEFDYGGAPVGE